MLAGHHTQTVLYEYWWYIVQIAGIRDQETLIITLIVYFNT